LSIFARSTLYYSVASEVSLSMYVQSVNTRCLIRRRRRVSGGFPPCLVCAHLVFVQPLRSVPEAMMTKARAIRQPLITRDVQAKFSLKNNNNNNNNNSDHLQVSLVLNTTIEICVQESTMSACCAIPSFFLCLVFRFGKVIQRAHREHVSLTSPNFYFE
jgi:hypothetical protein